MALNNNQITLGVNNEQVDIFAAYYTIIDLLIDLGGLAAATYFILHFFVPSEFLFISHMVDRTQTSLQKKTHLNPRFHNMNDSAVEMLTVAKDIFAKRTRVAPASITNTIVMFLCCRRVGAYAKLRN